MRIFLKFSCLLISVILPLFLYLNRPRAVFERIFDVSLGDCIVKEFSEDSSTKDSEYRFLVHASDFYMRDFLAKKGMGAVFFERLMKGEIVKFNSPGASVSIEKNERGFEIKYTSY